MTALDGGQPPAVPVELPALGNASAPQAPTQRAAEQFAATKDFSQHRRSVRRSERRRGPGVRGLAELNQLLSERDIGVLEVVSAHRFLTTRQVERFLFDDHASHTSGSRVCRRVLRRLETRQLLQRPLRRIGGLTAGSSSSVWLVSSRGLRLLNMRAGIGAVGRVREPGERFVQHYLAIADTHLRFVEVQRRGELELVDIQIEPACWRTFSGLGGSREVLKPDLYVVTASGRFEDHWFVEVDLGTESIPTLLRQCQVYEKYRRSGSEQLDQDVFPRALWIVLDEVRADKLRAALHDARHLDRELFRITTAEQFVAMIQGGAA